MTAQGTTSQTFEFARFSDIPSLAKLLLVLYEDECPRILPRDKDSFRTLLANVLSRNESVLESTLVVRDGGSPVASIVVSPSVRPRRSSLDMEYVAAALSRMGAGAGARVLWEQMRLMNLLCAPLPEKTAQVHSLVIGRDHRGRGFGVGLMRQAEELAREHGDRQLLLYVLEGNDVEALYHRLGYARVRVPSRSRIRYPGIAMMKSL